MNALVIMEEGVTRNVLKQVLEWESYRVSVCESVTLCRGMIDRINFGVLLLHLEDGHGAEIVEVVKELRVSGKDIPIIILSKDHNPKQAIALFKEGADEFIRCPFEAEELVCRLKAIYRRYTIYQGGLPIKNQGGISLDIAQLRVDLPDGHFEHLTPTEARVLACLLQQRGRVVTRREIARYSWGEDKGRDPVEESNPVDVYVRRLRKKIEPKGKANPVYLLTVRGSGYKILA